MTYLSDWNTNAKHSYVSNLLLGALLRVFRVEKLLCMRAFVEAIPGLLSYSERHYQRIDRLTQATYMIEYTQSLLAGLPIIIIIVS